MKKLFVLLCVVFVMGCEEGDHVDAVETPVADTGDIKFCNTLPQEDSSGLTTVTCTLIVSGDDEEITLTAVNGTCNTPLDDECMGIPAGELVISLYCTVLEIPGLVIEEYDIDIGEGHWLEGESHVVVLFFGDGGLRVQTYAGDDEGCSIFRYPLHF